MKDRLCTSETEFTPPACLALLCLVDKFQDLNFRLSISKYFAKIVQGADKNWSKFRWLNCFKKLEGSKHVINVGQFSI